uniref:Uncharacterized protein n=1 Tax=Oryza glumipatula TaxID=40148 RepID=A0A0D9ZVW0_9ORYZ
MMRSVEVGIQCSADGHALPHLDPAPGVVSANAVAAVAAVDILVFAVRCEILEFSLPPSLDRSLTLLLAEFLVALLPAESSLAGRPAAPPPLARCASSRRPPPACSRPTAAVSPLLPRRRATAPLGGMRRKLRKRRETERRGERDDD